MNSAFLPGNIGFDFDDVIADTAEAFLRIACEEYGYCEITLEHLTDFQIDQCLDIELQTIESIFTTLQDDPIGAGLKPKKGCFEVLEKLCDYGDISIITARPTNGPVAAWMDQHLPDRLKRAVQLIATGDHNGKTDYIKEAGLSHFIDDRGPTCQQIEQAGIRSILFNMPWNRNFRTLPSVQSWKDIDELCFPSHPM